jgi:hypothetical protein
MRLHCTHDEIEVQDIISIQQYNQYVHALKFEVEQ